MAFTSAREYAARVKSNALPHDWVAILYCFGAMLLITIFRDRVPHWWAYAAGHFAIIVVASLLAGSTSPRLRFIRQFDVVPYIVAIFFMNCILVHLINPRDYDDMLIRWDRSIGGLKLLKSMESITTPFLTTVCKLAWVVYYFVPLFVGIPLYRRKMWDAFNETKLIYVLGFLILYSTYFAMPAQGPGWFEKELDIAQPRWEDSKVASETKKAITILEGDARDTFPSGHAAVAVITIFVLVRNRLWVWLAFATPICLTVTASTIYLRYHYLSDVIGGFALAALSASFGCWWFRRHLDRKIVA